MAFWRSKPRSPAELVRALKESTLKLDASPYGSDARQKNAEDTTKTLAQMKILLCGDVPILTQPETTAQLAQEFYSNDIFSLLLKYIGQYEFEARKDVVVVFTHLLKRQIGSRLPTVEYLNSRPDVLVCALQGYNNPDVALNTGQMLHELLRHETLAKLLLNSGHVYDFKDYIERTTFGIACDAMTSLKELLTLHKPIVAEYLDRNYDEFFAMMTELISSDNYVTKRQSVKLLAELLLDKANYSVMTKYISSDENLKTIMLLLRDKAKNIQHEAFHVFKVFVANPRKAPNIESILRRNKSKLLIFLKSFQNDRDNDQFNDEKQFLIQQISAL